jgi:AraC-like DNA-binding protein
MGTSTIDLAAPVGQVSPWGASKATFLADLKQVIAFDVAALAVWNVQQPSADELIAAEGLSQAAVTKWCRAGFKEDPSLAKAIKSGLSVATPSDGGSTGGLIRASHVLVAMLPESIKENRWWWVVLSRSGEAFSEQEQQQLSFLLQGWHVDFNRPPERGMSRLVVGKDDRVLLTDLNLKQRLIKHPTLIEELLATLHPVVDQRFSDLADDTSRDFAVELGGVPFWVVFQKSKALGSGQSEAWYIELRPLGKDELPPVGEVEDIRIARAIAYLHEEFPRSPSLAQVSRAVHTSPFHFHRLFTRHVGVSPKQYLQRKQLQVAKWMLCASRSPIGTIAIESGFASHGHFTSTFHRIVGVSPSEYRDTNRV